MNARELRAALGAMGEVAAPPEDAGADTALPPDDANLPGGLPGEKPNGHGPGHESG